MGMRTYSLDLSKKERSRSMETGIIKDNYLQQEIIDLIAYPYLIKKALLFYSNYTRIENSY